MFGEKRARLPSMKGASFWFSLSLTGGEGKKRQKADLLLFLKAFYFIHLPQMQRVSCLSTAAPSLHTIPYLFPSHSHSASCLCEPTEPVPIAFAAHRSAQWKHTLAFIITLSFNIHRHTPSSCRISHPLRKGNTSSVEIRKPFPSLTTTVLPHLSIVQRQNPSRQQHTDAVSLEPGCKISQTPNESQSRTLLFSGILMVLYLSESTQPPRQK